jgi:hypothetical protein
MSLLGAKFDTGTGVIVRVEFVRPHPFFETDYGSIVL